MTSNFLFFVILLFGFGIAKKANYNNNLYCDCNSNAEKIRKLNDVWELEQLVYNLRHKFDNLINGLETIDSVTEYVEEVCSDDFVLIDEDYNYNYNKDEFISYYEMSIEEYNSYYYHYTSGLLFNELDCNSAEISENNIVFTIKKENNECTQDGDFLERLDYKFKKAKGTWQFIEIRRSNSHTLQAIGSTVECEDEELPMTTGFEMESTFPEGSEYETTPEVTIPEGSSFEFDISTTEYELEHQTTLEMEEYSTTFEMDNEYSTTLEIDNEFESTLEMEEEYETTFAMEEEHQTTLEMEENETTEEEYATTLETDEESSSSGSSSSNKYSHGWK
jgi:hypothetical protein